MQILLLAVVCIISSCGTIVHGTDQEVSLVTTPPGAEVRMDGIELGTTPMVLTLPRKQDYILHISKEGYHDHFAHVDRTLSGVAVFYLLPGGLLSLGVDAANGAQFDLPEKVDVELKELFHAETLLTDHLEYLKAMNRKLLLC